MKKIILLFMFFATITLTGQNMAFSVVEFTAKPYTQKDILKAFNDTYEGVKMNQGGIVLERIGNGRTNGATHRLVFMWTLGVEMMADDAVSDDKGSALWAKMRNFVDKWGTGYSGRILSWQEGDTDKNSNVHIWDIKIDDPNLFKAGHDKIVKKFKEDFSERVVGFGTYDIGRPNGASHWIALSGKDKNDHMMLYDKLQKDPKFIKLIQERGPVTDIKDYEVTILKRFQ
tara:strand:- start:7 stop:693 length:687 start_codon:yes stop_codon:yes gene_type:complete